MSCQSCVVYATFVGNSVLSFTTSKLNYEKTYIWEGGVWTWFVVRSTEKKEKARPSTDHAAALADKCKSPIKCCKSLRDLEQVKPKMAGGACMQLAIDSSLKLIGNDRHSLQFDTADLHRPSAFECAEKERKKEEIVFFFDCSRLSPCSFRKGHWTSREASLRETENIVWAGCGEERG